MRTTALAAILLIALTTMCIGASDERTPCSEMMGWAAPRDGSSGDEELLRYSRIVVAPNDFDVKKLGHTQEFWNRDGQFCVYSKLHYDSSMPFLDKEFKRGSLVILEQAKEGIFDTERRPRERKYYLVESPVLEGDPLAFRWLSDDSLLVTVKAVCKDGGEFTFNCLLDVAEKKFVYALGVYGRE